MTCNGEADTRPACLVNGVRDGKDVLLVDNLPDIFIRREEERPRISHKDFTCKIPVISLHGHKSEPQRSRIRHEICSACENWGMFQVTDHGVDEHLIKLMQTLTREFFGLPANEKTKFDMRGDDRARGGFVVGSPLPVKTHPMNYREFFIFSTFPVEDRDYSLWPDSPRGWKNAVEDYCEKMMQLAISLQELFSEALGLSPDAIAKSCIKMHQKVIANYYPRCPQPEMTLGLHPHTDIDIITLLLQDDSVSGLQVTDDGGKTWMNVPPISNAFVVNVGDYLMMASNGRFTSRLHQAVVNSEESRVSIGTFHTPAMDAVVYPMEGVVRDDEECRLKTPMTFAEMYRLKMSRDFQGIRQEEQKEAEKPRQL